MSEHEQSSPNWPVQNSEHVPPMWFFTDKDKEAEEAHERATHFEGFASLQWDDIEALLRKHGRIPVGQMVGPDFFPEVKALLAQRAYDLTKHNIENTKSGTLETAHFYFDESVSDIPDMTAWPEQSE